MSENYRRLMYALEQAEKGIRGAKAERTRLIRNAIVVLEALETVEGERDRLAAQVKRVEQLRDRWEAAVRDPSTYHGGAEHAAALAASHLPDLRRALKGGEASDVD
ncbi:hypothetical protein ACGFNU_21680 [Spirillospora sp. NPDC048911]|uniref:hypothetical protein n=1 Tax=Spirillospora sp. NPDC048911 TaxID=3364527 RepID=UPI003720901F